MASPAGDRSDRRGRGMWSAGEVVEGAGRSGMAPELSEAA